MSKIIELRRQMSAKVRLIDHAGELLRWLTPAEAAELIGAKRVEPLGTRGVIRAVRLCGAEPALDRSMFRFRSPGLGTSHRHETYFNPDGVWTIDHVPASTRPLFMAVVTDCQKAA